MNEFFKSQWEEFKESSSYRIVAENYSSLDPSFKKGVQYGAIGLFVIVMLYIPYFFYSSYQATKADVDRAAKAKHMLSEMIQFNAELKTATDHLKESFRLIGTKSIQNTVNQFVQNSQLPLEAVKNFNERVSEGEITTVIYSSFTLDRINFRHLMTFLSLLEDKRNGIVITDVKIDQSSRLDGYLNADIKTEAYSLKAL